MTVVSHSIDSHTISDVICNQRFEQHYLYYTKKESIAKFKEKYADEYELEREGDFQKQKRSDNDSSL